MNARTGRFGNTLNDAMTTLPVTSVGRGLEEQIVARDENSAG